MNALVLTSMAAVSTSIGGYCAVLLRRRIHLLMAFGGKCSMKPERRCRLVASVDGDHEAFVFQMVECGCFQPPPIFPRPMPIM